MSDEPSPSTKLPEFAQPNPNMKLWNEVSTTDPEFTKRVNQRGGFTAICAQYQLRRATEMWGAYGSEWGVNDCQYGLITDETGKPVEMWLEATFYYPRKGGTLGTFQISVDIAYKPGNDSRKKLLTDATTKALSKLGYNSDVFEGKFDDNKYVMSLGGEPSVPMPKRRRKANSTSAPPTPEEEAPPPTYETYDGPPMAAYSEPNGGAPPSEAHAAPASSADTVKIVEILPRKEGTGASGKWVLHKFKDSLDHVWSYFDETGLGERHQAVKKAYHEKLFVRIQGEENRFRGRDLESIQIIGDDPF